MTKAELRKVYLAKRKSFSRGERDAKSAKIRDRLFQNIDLTSVRYLHCFISIAKLNEIDTQLIFERLWNEHPLIKTVVPRLGSQAGEMDNVLFASDTPLAENAWNIPEPVHDEYVETGEIDIVLVPLLCFDRQGHRVGYGAGYYDRFLADCRPDCRKIGLSYFPPVDAIDDVNERDVPIDLCVTPDTVYKFT